MSSSTYQLILYYLGILAIATFVRFYRYTIKGLLFLVAVGLLWGIFWFTRDKDFFAFGISLKLINFCVWIGASWLMYKIGRHDKNVFIAWFYYINYVLFFILGSRHLFEFLNWHLFGWTEGKTGAIIALIIGALTLIPRLSSSITRAKTQLIKPYK